MPTSISNVRALKTFPLEISFQLVEDLPSGCKFNCFNWITQEPDQTWSDSFAFEYELGEGSEGRAGYGDKRFN